MSHIWSKSGNVWRGGMTVCRGDAVVTPVDLSVLATELLACQSHPQTICGSHGVTTPVSVEQTLQQKKWQNNKKNKKPTYTHTQTLLAFLAVFVWVHAHPPVTIRASVLHLSTTPLKLGGQKVETTQEWMSHLLHHLPISQSNPQVWTHANTALSHK